MPLVINGQTIGDDVIDQEVQNLSDAVRVVNDLLG